MDNDDIRRRRIERLAQLEERQRQANASQAASGVASNVSNVQNNTPTSIGSSARATPTLDPPQAPQQTTKQPAPKLTEPKQDLKQEPNKRFPALRDASKVIKLPTTANLITPSYVLGVSESLVKPTWKEQMEEGVDSMLWDQITERPASAAVPLEYLMGCYARLQSLQRSLPAIVAEVEPVIVTQALICATADIDDEVYSSLGACVTATLGGPNYSQKFVVDLLQYASEDESQFAMLVVEIQKVVLSFKFGDVKLTALFQIVDSVLEVPGAAEILLRLPSDETQARLAQDRGAGNKYLVQQTLLGALMALGKTTDNLLEVCGVESVLSTPVAELETRAKDSTLIIANLLESMQLRTFQTLIKRGHSTRRLVLNWFAMVLKMNHRQMATNRQKDNMNSFDFMLGCLKVLLKLAEPFVKLEPAVLPQQLAKVNPEYFANIVSFDVSEETKVLSEQQDAPFNSQKLDTPLNFVTECFFLTAGFLYYGAHAIIQALSGSMNRQLEYFENTSVGFFNIPAVRNMPVAFRDMAFQRHRQAVAALKCEIAMLEARMHDPEFFGPLLQFSQFELAFDVYAAQNGATPLTIRVAWDQSPPESFAAYPEFMVETPAVVASYIMRSNEFIRKSDMVTNKELLVNGAIFFMSSPKVVHNPYLRSKFAEMLFYGGADIQFTNGSTAPGPLSTLFMTQDTCRQYLLPALMAIFIDIEHTGRTSQFYEKFGTRDLVARILRVLWRDPHYSQQLMHESEEKSAFFVKFVALLLNDATFVLDEALSKLHSLNKLETEIREGTAVTSSSASTNAGNQNERNRDSEMTDANDIAEDDGEEEEDEPSTPAARLQSLAREIKNFLALSDSFVELLRTFTSSVPHIFATSEIVDRFAVMLNYNLAALVGPRCRELKVRNPAQYGFSPRSLLTDLVRVYLCMAKEPPFPKALAKDERSYRNENFKRAHQILHSHSLLSPIDLDKFTDLAEHTRVAWQEAQEEDEDYGDDIPDEYLDPLMFTLMEDPVMLPTSKVNIDLSTIKTHLLSDPTDPFNRVPLQIEEVIPNLELKQEIEEFKRKKKEQRHAS